MPIIGFFRDLPGPKRGCHGGNHLISHPSGLCIGKLPDPRIWHGHNIVFRDPVFRYNGLSQGAANRDDENKAFLASRKQVYKSEFPACIDRLLLFASLYSPAGITGESCEGWSLHITKSMYILRTIFSILRPLLLNPHI